MSDTDRIKATIRNKQSTLAGLNEQIKDHGRQLDKARRDSADAGRHYDAYLRQQDAQRKITEHQNSMSSLERQVRSTENEIKGLEAELRSRR